MNESHPPTEQQLDAQAQSVNRHTRRNFLRFSALAGAGMAASWASPFDSLVSAGAQTTDDYRAIVCVFLYGGNDHYNTFVPNDSANYREYARLRGSLAVPSRSILSINPTNGFAGAGTLGFAPQFSRLHGLFGNGHAALVANVGSMVAPLQKPTWDSNPALIPPSLGSHNDQQSFWMSGLAEGANSGWGGRIGDSLNPLNVRNGGNPTFMSTSIAGNAVFLTGQQTQQFQVSTSGPTALGSSDFDRATSMNAALDRLLRTEASGLFPEAYSAVSKRALESSDQLEAALTNVEASHNFDRRFAQPTELADQLKMVAKMITAGKNELNLKRQVFFVGMGGFDTHNELAETHPALLSIVDDAMASFYQTTLDLGVANEVTAFTGSDFGRTLSINDSGSDHGWGSTHIVVGGAVRGNRAYGQVPTVALDGPNSTGRGRQLPTTAVDQYGSTLARWMGAGSDIEEIFPRIGRFDSDDLGFLA